MAITIQASYGEDKPIAYRGMVADGGTTKRRKATIAPASGGLEFGAPAFYYGFGENLCTATPAAGKFMGIVICDAGNVDSPPIGFATPDTFKREETVPLLTRGRIYVAAGANVQGGQPVYVTPSGSFTNVAGGNVAIPAVFDESRLSGSIVALHVLG